MSLLLALSLCLQDEFDARLAALAGRMGPDALSQKAARILATPGGRQAVRERIDFVVYARTGRIERDPLGAFEDHLFAADLSGLLRLRPERREEFDGIAREAAAAPKALAGFHRRAEAFAASIGGSSDLDRRARELWRDPAFRLAFFHRTPGELAELSDADLLDGLIQGGEAAAAIRTRIETARLYGPSYRKLLEQEKDAEVRKTAAGETARVFILGKLLRQVEEGSDLSIGGVTEGEPPGLSLNLSFADLLEDVRAAEAFAATLAPALDRAAASLGEGEEEARLAAFLRGGTTRLLLAEKMLDLKRLQGAKAEAVFDAVRADGFEEKGGRLAVKKGRYVDENGADSIDALNAEHQRAIDEFEGSHRYSFDLVAERCADPAVAAVFASREATYVLFGHLGRISASRKEEIERQGLEIFLALYFEGEGDRLVARPGHASRIEDLARRAAELQKEQEK